MCPLKHFDLCPLKIFWLECAPQHSLYLIYAAFCRKLFFCRDYALFGGHFLLKFGGEGHKNILRDRAPNIQEVNKLHWDSNKQLKALKLMFKCVFWIKLVIPYKYVYFTFIRRGGHHRANSFHTTKKLHWIILEQKTAFGAWFTKKLHLEPNLLQWPRSQQRDITLPLPLYYRFFYALSTNFADLFFFFLYMQANIIWSS